MMIFRVNVDDAEVQTKSMMALNANRIRKAWVSAVKESPLEIRIMSYPRNARFELYKHIDECIRVAYIEDMRKYKEKQSEIGNYSDLAILGRRILDQNAQRDLDKVLFNAVESALINLNANIPTYE